VLEEVPTFCKIKLKGSLPPLKIKISYENSGDLDVYASMINREPQEQNCQYKYKNNPQLIQINKTNGFEKEEFQENAIYFRFDSEHGIKVTIKTSFEKVSADQERKE